MDLSGGNLYHVYNQGNNRQKIFYRKSNYLFFIRKIKEYILPYAEVFAWCLMPNHFHLMLYVNKEVLPISEKGSSAKLRTINNSIGIMLRSYVRAINKQEERSGALFRQTTKAECINCEDKFLPSFIMADGVSKININYREDQYPQVCFNYIHNNPIKAKLAHSLLGWDYSSAQEYYGGVRYGLVNKDFAIEYIDI